MERTASLNAFGPHRMKSCLFQFEESLIYVSDLRCQFP